MNTLIQGVEMTKYEIGLRSFMEIGYKNIVSFLCTVGEEGNRHVDDQARVLRRARGKVAE